MIKKITPALFSFACLVSLAALPSCATQQRQHTGHGKAACCAQAKKMTCCKEGAKCAKCDAPEKKKK